MKQLVYQITDAPMSSGESRPVRDEDSTTYTAAIETAEAFGPRLYTEA